MKETKISLDNGLTLKRFSDLTSEDKIYIVKHWSAIVETMDNDIREKVASELDGCSEIEFLNCYLELACEHITIG